MIKLLKLENIGFSIQEKEILRHISLEIAAGQFVGIIGPNGSGKSTMLKIIYRHFKQTAGIITLHENEIWDISAQKFAQKMAVVSQESTLLFDFTVRDLVLMGRTPYKKWLSTDKAEDFSIVEECMQLADISHLENRTLQELSGGEKKRVMLARALAQQADILVLDEPTNHLDVEHQLQLMELVKNLPITIIAALHDLNLAAAYCDELLVLKNGILVAQGPPDKLLTVALLGDVFSVEAGISINPYTEKLHIFFINHKNGVL